MVLLEMPVMQNVSKYFMVYLRWFEDRTAVRIRILALATHPVHVAVINCSTLSRRSILQSEHKVGGLLPKG